MDMGGKSGTEAGTKTYLISEFEYMPPKNSTDYQTKPLPAVPPQHSMASSSSSQVNNAFRTPARSVDSRQLGRDWERDANDEANIWDNRVGVGHSWDIPKIDVSNIPPTPPDEILSPQPKQSVQKILKLTGKISPTESVSSVDSPTLHNSQQKIKQLTGLDVGSGATNHNQLSSLHALQDDVSPISLSSSMYSQEGLETAISELEKESSEYSYQYMDDEFMEVTTPLSPPNFRAFSTRPLSTAPVSPTSTPAALRLGGVHGGNHTEKWSQLDEPPHHQDIGAERASSRESSPSDRVINLYHTTTTTSYTTKSSAPRLGTGYSAAAWSPQPAAPRRSVLWGGKPSELFQSSRLNLSSPSSPLPPTAVGPPRRETDSFSDRRASSRNRVPPPLEQAREAPKPGRHTLPQRTPYPLPSPSLRSAFDEDDGRKRFSLLSKVFSSSSSSSSKKRVSSASRGSSVQSSREDRSTAVVPISSYHAHWIEGPDAPWEKSTASAPAPSSERPAPAGLGVFQRTMESARQSVGLKSKAEKRRQGLKGKIRVVGPEEMGRVAGSGSR